MPEFSLTARCVLSGATMCVEAENEEEARRLAEEEPDWDFDTASMADITITQVQKEREYDR